jgi:hypothetical protein
VPCAACGTGTTSCTYPGNANEFICVTGNACPQ